MLKVLALLRRQPLINYPFRSIFKTGTNFFSKLSSYWPVSGIISFDYDGIPIKVFNRCDDGFVQTFYYGKEYQESNILAITDAFAKKSDTILDIGANTGIDAIIIAKKNPQVKVIAVEPYEPNYNRLEKNIELNGVTNIDVLKIALGNENDTLQFTVPKDGRISDVPSAVDGVGKIVYPELDFKKVDVQQKTLDSLNLPSVRFFKCDVEGFEMSVLKGGMEFIKRNKPTFVVEIALLSEEKIDFFNRFATDFGYTIYLLNETGLIKLDKFYNIDWRGDYLFTTYNHDHNFIPSKDIVAFVNNIK